jgi:hypothetical protein
VFAAGEAAALLCGTLLLLQELQLAVAVPDTLGSAVLVETQLPGLLAQLGTTTHVACTDCAELGDRNGADLVALATLQVTC